MNNHIQCCQTLLAASISLCLALSVCAGELNKDDIEHLEISHQKQPYRGDVPLKATPQAVAIVTGEFLLDVGVVELQNALDYSSGIVRQNNFGGMWDGFAIRGFAGDENLPSGYLINGFSAGRGYSGRRNTTNVQSIEILKGPGSALFGRSEPGGTVNIITKKPQFFEDGYIQASVGNYNKKRIEGDYTNKINDDIAFRVNGSFDDSESYRHTIETKHTTLNSSLLWNISEQTNLSYEMEYVDQKVPFDRGVVVLNNNFNTIPREQFLGEPDDGPMEIKATGHQLVLQHELNNDWDLLTGLGYRKSSFEGFGSEVDLNAAQYDTDDDGNFVLDGNGERTVKGRQLLLLDGETAVRIRNYRDYDTSDLSLRVELSGSFTTGSFMHHMLIGIDAYDYELETFQDRFRVGWGSKDTTFSINLFEPVYHQNLPTPTPLRRLVEKQKSQGIYVQDQIDLNDKWKALVGIRFDKFDQSIINNLSNTSTKQDKTATSPRVGLVYEANEQVTLYTSYAEGFRPNAGADFAGNAFEPEESKSYEVGVKWSSNDGLFDGTLAVYKAEKSNILSADPANGGFSAALGEAESKGIEVDITSNIGGSTTLALAYAYTDAYTANDIINADWGVDIPSGSNLINIAKNTATLTLRHYLTLQGKDADIGASYNYVGDRLGETIDPSYVLPSYSVVRLFSSVTLNDKFTVKFDIDNLFDKEYFASSYSALWTMPGTPRTYRASVQYQF